MIQFYPDENDFSLNLLLYSNVIHLSIIQTENGFSKEYLNASQIHIKVFLWQNVFK